MGGGRAGLPARYGYRAGFSGPELALLGAQWETHGMEAAVRAAGRGAKGIRRIDAGADESPAVERQ